MTLREYIVNLLLLQGAISAQTVTRLMLISSHASDELREPFKRITKDIRRLLTFTHGQGEVISFLHFRALLFNRVAIVGEFADDIRNV